MFSREYLLPEEDRLQEELENIIHSIIKGTTGLSADRIRPKYQEQASLAVPQTEDWCSFGIDRAQTENFATPVCIKGKEYIVEHEALSVRLTFYGRKAFSNATGFRSAFMLEHNRAILRRYDMAFVEISELKSSAELVNSLWVMKAEITFTVRREIKREARIDYITAAGAELIKERDVQ